MLVKSCKGGSTLSLMMLSLAVQLPLILPGLAETLTLESQVGDVATSSCEASCHPACPVWVFGAG
jgi:hypothetical protein